MLTLTLADEAATVAAGEALGRALHPLPPTGLVVHLEGELGAGKTTLCRGVLRALGHRGAVKSPTYTLVETYEFADLTLHHFDLYRLHDPEELEFMGIRDYCGSGAVALVEWPSRGGGHLPPADMVVALALDGAGRRLQIRACSATGVSLLDRVQLGK